MNVEIKTMKMIIIRLLIISLLFCPLFGRDVLATPIAYVDYVSGDTAMINKGSGPEQLKIGDDINLGDSIETNSSRVQYSFNGTYSGYTRMGIGASVEFESPPSALVTMLPGLDWSANFKDGEILLASSGDGKYRTSCYIRRMISSTVFLQPGSGQNEDLFFAIDESIEIFDFQPITSTDPADWTSLLSLSSGEMGSLSLDTMGFHTAGTPQPISNADLAYIEQGYLNDNLWVVPEPSTLILFFAGGIILFLRKGIYYTSKKRTS